MRQKLEKEKKKTQQKKHGAEKIEHSKKNIAR